MNLRPRLRSAVCAATGAALCLSAAAGVELDDVTLDESAQVGGQQLRLNGAGIAARLIFKIYAMGLYLPDRMRVAEQVLRADGPRRITLVPLRDISAQAFQDAVLQDLTSSHGRHGARTMAQMAALAGAIARRPQGLRKGDVLTLDWIPGTGAVATLNQAPLGPAVHDIDFYNAMLAIWLGERPTDPALKARLLGTEPLPARQPPLPGTRPRAWSARRKSKSTPWSACVTVSRNSLR